MVAVERENEALKDVLPKDYARPALDKDSVRPRRGSGQQHRRSAAPRPAPPTSLAACTNTSWSSSRLAEGRKGGEFYTPRSVVRLLVEMLEPYHGPCV